LIKFPGNDVINVLESFIDFLENDFSVDGSTVTYDTGILIECGFYSDIMQIEGDFTQSYVVSSVQHKDLDGGPIIRDETGDILSMDQIPKGVDHPMKWIT
jgi:hypothetical protein